MAPQTLCERGLERAVELDCVDVRHALGEVRGEDAEAGTDLEHDVVRPELGEPADHAEDVLVGQEVLAEPLLGADHARPNAAVAFASSCAASAMGSSPRASASTATVWTTLAGSFGRPRRGCGLRYGLSVSARRRVGRDAARGLPQLFGLRVRDVAGERDVIAALERDRQQRRAREAVQNDRAVEAFESGGGLLVGVARVDDDRLAEVSRELELPGEEIALPVARRVVAVEVEPGLADGDRTRVAEQLAELVEPGCVVIRGLVRVDAEGGPDSVVSPGEVERRAARVEPRADRDDALHAGLAGPPQDQIRRIRARVEVRVGVDHWAASILASSSATTRSGSSFLKSGTGSPTGCPGRIRLGAHSPTHDS